MYPRNEEQVEALKMYPQNQERGHGNGYSTLMPEKIAVRAVDVTKETNCKEQGVGTQEVPKIQGRSFRKCITAR